MRELLHREWSANICKMLGQIGFQRRGGQCFTGTDWGGIQIGIHVRLPWFTRTSSGPDPPDVASR